MEGNAAHGRLLFLWLRPIPGREGQIQFPRSKKRVLIEHFIEIAQTEKENAVLMLILDCPVLPLHGCQFIHFLGHITGSFSKSCFDLFHGSSAGQAPG